MFFIASKMFWALAQPLSLVFLLGLLGWLLGLVKRRRLALTFGGLALLIFGLSSFTTLGFNLITPLENRFDRPATPPENVTTIVMLGGATAGRVSTARKIAELTEAGDRLAETVRLAGVYPSAKIIVSGGVGLLIADGEPEANTALRFFTDHAIARQRIVLEAESRNTDENAAFTADLVGDDAGQVLLVTSAFHMPRSLGLFRNVGIDAVPWPVDYRSAGNEGFGLDVANPVLNITTTGVAIREWLGLLAYHWTGRTETLFPGPLG